ncbi:MAG: hypothetical protein LPH21_18410 [Shewanella sp.]|nr:hypothetical protein [Shewanella sp.]
MEKRRRRQAAEVEDIKPKLTGEAAERVSADERKPSREYATMWLAMIVVDKLDGIHHPVRDFVTTKAITSRQAVRNIGAYYNHRRRVNKTTIQIIMLMTFSEFVTKRMCIDYESMPMLDKSDDFDDLPDAVVEEIIRVSKMTQEQVMAEVDELYANERKISEARPMVERKQVRGIGTKLPDPEPKEVPAPTRRRTREVQAEPEQPARRRRARA